MFYMYNLTFCAHFYYCLFTKILILFLPLGFWFMKDASIMKDIAKGGGPVSLVLALQVYNTTLGFIYCSYYSPKSKKRELFAKVSAGEG